MDEVSTGRRPFLQAGLAALAAGLVDPVQGEPAAERQQADERPVLVWQRTYDGAEGNGVRLLEASDAGYLMVVNVGSSGLKLISVDTAGDVAWERTYGASASESGLYYDAVADGDGGYVVAGYVGGSAELLRDDGDGDASGGGGGGGTGGGGGGSGGSGGGGSGGSGGDLADRQSDASQGRDGS